MLNEAATYDKVTRHNFILHSDLGMDLGFSQEGNFIGIARLSAHVGIGYKFFVLTAGYEKGLRKVSLGSSSAGYGVNASTTMQTSLFTFGAIFYPSTKQLMSLKRR